ncbi:MAG TPA: hypothetical protein VJ259_01235, partial [Actinomycetota bacterium]|nr:hypothetical protein [Actinomycetota bacterium]
HQAETGLYPPLTPFIALVLASLTALIAGVGLVRLGIVPSFSQVGRLLVWLAVTVVYVAFWLGLATLCSVAMRRAATSALVAIASWLVLALFAGLLTGLVAHASAPVGDGSDPEQFFRNARLEQQIGWRRWRSSIGAVVAHPRGPDDRVPASHQVDRAVASELSLDQSLLLA